MKIVICCHKKRNSCFLDEDRNRPAILCKRKKEGGFFWLQIRKQVPFYNREEQKEQLQKVIQKLRDEKGC